MEENFLRYRFSERDVTLHGDKHGGGARRRRRCRGGIYGGKEQRHSLHAEDFATQDRVAALWSGNNLVVCAGQKFVDGCRGQSLLDAVT